MKGSKAVLIYNMVIAVVQMAFGVLCTFFGLFCLLMMRGINGGDIALVVIFGGGGIWLIIASAKKQRLIKLFRQYQAIMADGLGNSIIHIARTTGTEENIVMKNMQKLIDKRYFGKAYIDLRSGCVRLLGQQQNEKAGSEPFSEQPTARPGVQVIAVTCECCGGVSNIAKGHTGKCEYCGAPIKGE